MITVRFPSGFSVQYNNANWAKPLEGGRVAIYETKGTGWIALAPEGALVEIVIPCRTYNPVSESSQNIKQEIQTLQAKVRGLTTAVNKVVRAKK